MGWFKATFEVLGDFLGEAARGISGGIAASSYASGRGVDGFDEDDGPKAWGIGPTVNIDGAPMVGDSGVDIYGNVFGVTQDDFDFGSLNDVSGCEMDFGGCDSNGMFD